MPRNSSGACTLAEAAFVANTPIRAADMNSDLDDIATMLTDSLSRSGSGGMQTTLSLAPTGFAYAVDPDTGMARSAANTQVITVGGSSYTFTATDLTAPGGASLLPLVGEIRMWAFATAPTGWVLLRGQACTTTYPLWRAALIADGSKYGTSGGDPLFPDMRCVLPAGLDVGGRGLLTGSTVLGALLGTQTKTLITGNLPPYTPTGAISDGRSWAFPERVYAITGGAGAPQTVSDPTSASAPQVSVGVAPTGSITFAGDAQGGSSTPVSVVQPTVILNFIGRAA